MKIYWELFPVFMRIGAFTFGGGYAMLPLIQKETTDKGYWVTEEEITDYYVVAQYTPGIIMMNTMVFIGFCGRGILGVIITTLDVVTPSITITLLIAPVLTTYSSLIMVQYALAGICAVVYVLVLNTVVELWKSGIKDTFGILLFAAVLAAIAFISTSTVLVVTITALLDVIVCALRRRGVKE